MNIAIIGSGNIGGTLAEKWAKKGHHIFVGLRDKNNFKGSIFLIYKTFNFYPYLKQFKNPMLF